MPQANFPGMLRETTFKQLLAHETLQKIYDAVNQIRKPSTLLLNPLYINMSSYFLLCRITQSSVAAAIT
jgi:hypothetical protein